MIRKRTSLQRVKYFYGKGILFGCYGCRWHRYQQSVDRTGVIDRLFYFLLLLITINLSIWMYFWVISSGNEFHNINIYFFNFTGSYSSWHMIIQSIVGAFLVYCVLLSIFGFIHILFGYEVHLHISHKILLLLIIGFAIGTIVYVTSVYPEGWSLALISLQIFGLYIQIGVVVFTTIFTWFFSGFVVDIHSNVIKSAWICFYAIILLALYISPHYIKSPCVMEKNSIIPPKPKLIAHRGASMYAPENTEAAFVLAANNKNVEVIEADLRMSFDGVPFIMHDEDLIRTSNIRDIYPDRWKEKASTFTIAELKALDVGSWFLKLDPFKTVHSLSESQKNLYKNQTIILFSALLEILKEKETSLIFEKNQVPDAKLLKLINDSGIENSKIWWSQSNSGRYNDFYTYTTDVLQYPSRHNNISLVYYKYSWIHWTDVKKFRDEEIKVGIWNVNSDWHFSYWWCANADYVTTDDVHLLENLTEPKFIMKQSQFRWIWISSNFFCGCFVIVIFLCQFYRNTDMSKPDIKKRLSSFRRSKNMKIGLIGNAEGIQQIDSV